MASRDLADILEGARSAGEAEPEGAVLQALRRGDLKATAQTYSQDLVRQYPTGVRGTVRGLDKRAAMLVPLEFWIAPDGRCEIDWSKSAASSSWVVLNANDLTRDTITAAAVDIFAPADDVARLWPPGKGRNPSGAVSTKERNTLLKLVLGMAMAKFQYKPGARSSAATNIRAKLAEQGISVSDDTIRNYLSEAVEKGLHQEG